MLDGAVERRAIEVAGVSAIYPAAAIGEDFPAGIGAGASVAVAQYGADWGWGSEASVRLVA